MGTALQLCIEVVRTVVLCICVFTEELLSSMMRVIMEKLLLPMLIKGWKGEPVI